MARVSVIIAAYNPGRYLQEAVQSVIAQTFDDWELIVIDDGSKEEMSSIAELDTRIRYFRQSNHGTAYSNNVGVLKASGELLAFLDADDVWKPGKLQMQVDTMDASPEIGLCHTHYDVVDQDLNFMCEGPSAHITSYHALLLGNSIAKSSVMVRRETAISYGLFSLSKRNTEDFELWLAIARFLPIVFIPTSLCLYRRHDNNITNNYRLTCHFTLSLLGDHLESSLEKGDIKSAQAARKGIKGTIQTFGNDAFNTARETFALRDKSWVSHLIWGTKLAPRVVARRVTRYVLRKP